MKITVYAEMAGEVRKKLDRIAKKAASYNIDFSYSVSDEVPVVVRVMSVDLAAPSTMYESSRHTVAGVNIDVECDGLIKASGWKLCAMVEHGKSGNIVTAFDNYKVPRDWYTAPPKCDHCHTSMARKVTYFVQNDDGCIKQVGKACLKEYTGIDPVTATMWAEIHDMTEKNMNCTEDEFSMNALSIMYSTEDIIAHSYDCIREHGYRKSADANSTKEMVANKIASGENPSEEAIIIAREIVDWLKNMNRDTASDLEMNCIPLALSGYAKASHIGRLAYMPIAFQKCQENKSTEDLRKKAESGSQYVGEIGKRIIITASKIVLLKSWDTLYGSTNIRTTYLYKILDADGNVFIWRASNPCEAGQGQKIKATVKEHGERDGVRQTVVTRCSVIK